MFTQIICRLGILPGRLLRASASVSVGWMLLLGVAASEESRWDFDLPADSAENSLKRFSQQFAPGVIFPTDLIKGVRTNAVHGRLTGREALDRLLAGTSLRAVHDPQTGGFAITWDRLYNVIFAGLIFVGLLLALRYTPLGLHMRAVTQNRRMASSMGIRTGRVDALTFGPGSGIA